jgi:hypothetical protein
MNFYTHDLQKFNQKDVNNVNTPITDKKIEDSSKKSLGLEAFAVNATSPLQKN